MILWIIGGAFLLLFVIIAGIFIGCYNKLVRLKNTVKSAWSDIDVQLKKRYDVVPQLIEVVKGASNYEKSLLENVIAARTGAMGATNPSLKAKAEQTFGDSIKSLFAVAEAYPELKANTNYAILQGQLKELEDTIECARRYYNAVSRDFNIGIESFPSNIVASKFRFQQVSLFELESPETEKKPPKISFS
jgi:LemA protein